MGAQDREDADEDAHEGGDAAEQTVVVDVPRPGPVARRVSMATRLAFVVLVVTIVSLLVTSIAGLDQGQRLGEDLARDRLESVKSSQTRQLGAELSAVGSQAQALAASPETADAIAEFGAAFDELEATPGSPEQTAALRAYLREEVIPELEEARGRPVSVSEALPTSVAGLYLQNAFIVDSPASRGREDSVDDPGDGSTWTSVHRDRHPDFRGIGRLIGLDDVYLVDADGDVVYSAAKRTDLGTNLEVGPLSGSTLGALFDEVSADPSVDVAYTDLAPYAPAGEEALAFVASPVLDGEAFVGMVVFAVAAEKLTDIVSAGGDWEALGLGDTGELYVVGGDGTLRTEARAFQEDPGEYVETALAAGTLDEGQADEVERKGTTVLIQPANPDTFRTVDEDGVRAATNYLGREVVSTASPLETADLGWSIVAEVEVDELDQPVADYGGRVVVAVAVAVVILTFLATLWAGRLTAPLRFISARLLRVDDLADDDDLGLDDASADDDLESELPRNSPREFVGLAASFDDMLTTLQARRREVVGAHDERVDLLRRFLPPGVARRVEQGERNLLDHVPNASVAAVTIRGLGDLVRRGSVDENRAALEQLVDTLDDHATDAGLERVKLTGDTYIATCGVNRSYLDHVPRSVRFALAVRDKLATAEDAIDVTVGVHCGPMTVGLSGSALLVYDTWGPTVAEARRIAHLGRAGQVLVSTEAASQLPANVDVRATADDGVSEVVATEATEEATP